MAVVCDALSVIVRTETLDRLFTRGVAGYQAQVPNRSFASDGLLTRVGVMSPQDLQVYIDRLNDQGLELFGTNSLGESIAIDVSVIDQVNGLTIATPWLKTSVVNGVRIAWLAGTEPGSIHGPAGWSPRASTSFTRHEPDDLDHLLFATTNTPGLHSVLDPSIGEVSFTPQPAVPYVATMKDAATAFQEGAYRKAYKLLHAAETTRPLQPQHRVLAARIQLAVALQDSSVDELDPMWHRVARAWEEVVRLDGAGHSPWASVWAYAITRCGEPARAREALLACDTNTANDPWSVLASLRIAQDTGGDIYAVAETLYGIHESLAEKASADRDPLLWSIVVDTLYDFSEKTQPPKATKSTPARQGPSILPAKRRASGDDESTRENTGTNEMGES